MKPYYTEENIVILWNSAFICFVTNEVENSHILDWYKKHDIKVKERHISTGDYYYYIPHQVINWQGQEILFEGYYSTYDEVIERKNSFTELRQSLGKEHHRFYNELYRAKANNTNLRIFVETPNGYEDLVFAHYRHSPKKITKKKEVDGKEIKDVTYKDKTPKEKIEDSLTLERRIATLESIFNFKVEYVTKRTIARKIAMTFERHFRHKIKTL